MTMSIIFCMKRLVMSLIIASIQREIVVLLILKLSRSVDATRSMIMIKLIYIAIHSTNIWNVWKKSNTVSVVGFERHRIKIDICSILNEKEKESIETQKIGPEQPIVTATSKKSKRARDETSHIEECIQKLKRRKQPQKWISWKNKMK